MKASLTITKQQREMTMMTEQEKNDIMAGSIKAAIEKHKPSNMTQLAVCMGLLKKGQSVSGSFSKKVKTLVPDIQDLFKANGGKDEAAGKDEGNKEETTTASPKTARGNGQGSMAS